MAYLQIVIRHRRSINAILSVSALCLVLAACISSVSEELPLAELPEISVGTELSLVASPDHPSSYLPGHPLERGTTVQLMGTDTDAAWLLVQYDGRLGWMPAIFSSSNVSTIAPAFEFELPGDRCSKYLGTSSILEEEWVSSHAGSVTAIGSLFLPHRGDGFEDTELVIHIEGEGQPVRSDYVHEQVTKQSSIALYTYELNGIEVGSRISFSLTAPNGEPVPFQVAYFGNTCESGQRFRDRLPVGLPRRLNPSPPCVSINEPEPQSVPPSAGDPIRVESGVTAPTPEPTSVAEPDSNVYGEKLAIEEVKASTVYISDWHEPEMAFDSNTSTFWQSNVDDEIGAWLEVGIGDPMTLLAVRIFTPRSKLAMPRLVSVIFSDGSQQQIEMTSGSTWKLYELDPTITTDVRFLVDSIYNSGLLNSIRFNEIQLYGRLPSRELTTDNPAVSVSIGQLSSATASAAGGQFRCGVQFAGELPSDSVSVQIRTLASDVAGDLMMDYASPVTVVCDSSLDEQTELPAGDYLLSISEHDRITYGIVPGWYSDSAYADADKGSYRGVVFPISVGHTTEIKIQLSSLQIGTIDQTGLAVRGTDHPGWTVQVCPIDISPDQLSESSCARRDIDSRGAAGFHIAPGAYRVRVSNHETCYWEQGIAVESAPEVEKLIRIDTESPDGCDGAVP